MLYKSVLSGFYWWLYVKGTLAINLCQFLSCEIVKFELYKDTSEELSLTASGGVGNSAMFVLTNRRIDRIIGAGHSIYTALCHLSPFAYNIINRIIYR